MKKRFFTYLIALLLPVACNIDKNKTISPTDIHNKTTDNSVLFFKNMRSLDYDKEEQYELKRELYLHQDRNTTEDKPVLNFVIVYLWSQDRAYIVAQPNTFLSQYIEKNTGDTLKIRWKNPTTKAQGTLIYLAGHVDTQYEFATRMYNTVLSNDELYLLPDQIPILDTKAERETLRITLLDYYRLVGVFK